MTFTVSRHTALASLALAITAPAALADTIAPATLPSVIVTASRIPQAASDVLSDHVSIGPEEIARSGAGSVTELLQRQRGIEVVRYGGAGTSSSVFLRGSGSNQHIVLVDGVRINSSALGSAAWSAIPLSAIDHVEIVYGPLSTLYGADAIGGVIQIFTKQGDGAPRVSAALGAGSHAARTYDASVAGASGGEHNFSYALSAGKEKSDEFSAIKPGSPYFNADKDGYDKENAGGRFALQLAKGHEIGLLFLHSRLDAQFDNGPGYDARGVQKLDNVAVFTRNAILPNWSSQLQLARSRDQSTSDGGSMAWDKFQISATQTDISWQNDIRLGTDNLQILFGHNKEEVQSDSTPGILRERSTKSAALSYNLQRGRHLASFSLREDDNSQYGSKTTGALSYGYRLSNALRANASYGTSFRAPTVYDLYVPFFGIPTNRPEQGRNAEAGLHFDDGTTQLGAVYFHNRLRDLLVFANPCGIDPLNYPFGCTYNVDRAVLEGVSLSARRRFGALSVASTIDLQDPRDERSGKTLARRAKRHGSLALDYDMGALTLGTELQVSGKRFDDAANSNPMGGYGLLNLFASYRLAPDWSLLARWNNVTDKQYELAKDFATAGSTLFVGLRYGIK